MAKPAGPRSNLGCAYCYYLHRDWSPKNQFITDQDIQFWLDNFAEVGIVKAGQLTAADVYTNEFNPASGK